MNNPFSLPLRVSLHSDNVLAWIEDAQGRRVASFPGPEAAERARLTALAINSFEPMRKALDAIQAYCNSGWMMQYAKAEITKILAALPSQAGEGGRNA